MYYIFITPTSISDNASTRAATSRLAGDVGRCHGIYRPDGGWSNFPIYLESQTATGQARRGGDREDHVTPADASNSLCLSPGDATMPPARARTATSGRSSRLSWVGLAYLGWPTWFRRAHQYDESSSLAVTATYGQLFLRLYISVAMHIWRVLMDV